jgi:hypothetical protein
MAPKFNVRETLAVAIKEGNPFPAVVISAWTPPAVTTMPDKETEQSTPVALGEAHREREQPSPFSFEHQKRKDPPLASKIVIAAPTEAKRRRMN